MSAFTRARIARQLTLSAVPGGVTPELDTHDGPYESPPSAPRGVTHVRESD
jgi:hypothetical protein